MKKGLMVTLILVGLLLVSVNFSLAVNNSTNTSNLNSSGIIIPCVPNIVNTSFSEWKNTGNCRNDDKVVQMRNATQYDNNSCGSVSNQTFKETRETSCNYCNESISSYLTDWSLCSSNNTKQRTKYFVDEHYYFCCKVTGLSSDCNIKNGTYYANSTLYSNVTETVECDPFNFTVEFPNNFIYNSMRVNLKITSDKNLFSKLEIKDYSEKNSRWNLLCKNCLKYEKTKTFVDGFHNISIRGSLIDGRSLSEGRSFIVDTKNPVIIAPRIRSKGYTNGLFLINYTEDNLDKVTLFYGGKNLTKTSSECFSGKNKQCSFQEDLINYTGNRLEYYFVIKDIAGNAQKSKVEKAIVDQTAPQILNLSYSVIFNDVYFKIYVNESNFQDISYIDNSEKNAKWKVLCSRLDKNGLCAKKQGFSK